MADVTEDIAGILLFRSMEVPGSPSVRLDELSEGTIGISAATRNMIEQLDKLAQIGSRGRKQKMYLK